MEKFHQVITSETFYLTETRNFSVKINRYTREVYLSSLYTGGHTVNYGDGSWLKTEEDAINHLLDWAGKQLEERHQNELAVIEEREKVARHVADHISDLEKASEKMDTER